MGEDKAPGTVRDNGQQNPVIYLTPDEVATWLRSVADAHGYTDREAIGIQFGWTDAETGRQVLLDVPDLAVMVSNVPGSRPSATQT